MLAFRKALLLALMLLALNIEAALAVTYFDSGKTLFDKRQYSQALPYFHKAAEDSPWDSTAAYYEALCYHNLHDLDHARNAYKSIVQHFPGTPAYQNAIVALQVLDPGFVQAHNRPSSASATASAASIGAAGATQKSDMSALLAKVIVTAPAECQIPAKRALRQTAVDGSINGRGFKFNFDESGTTAISLKDAKSMNLPVNSGHALVTIKVGQISESNFPLTVDDTSEPRLGSDFFYQFTYVLQPSSIVAKKRAGGMVQASSWDVPFRKMGKDVLINIQVNGRNVSVILDDTVGGENIVPRNRVRDFGLDVTETSTYNRYDPVNNPDGALRGQSGYDDPKEITAADGKMVVGPVNSQIRFKIDDKASEAKITPSAFGSWKPVVDPVAGKIHFTR